MTTAYHPIAFLDWLTAKLNLKNDAALSRALGISPPVVSKIRHYRLPVGDTLILRIHENYGIPVAEIRAALAGEAPA